jgi:hypothetical protein
MAHVLLTLIHRLNQLLHVLLVSFSLHLCDQMASAARILHGERPPLIDITILGMLHRVARIEGEAVISGVGNRQFPILHRAKTSLSVIINRIKLRGELLSLQRLEASLPIV